MGQEFEQEYGFWMKAYWTLRDSAASAMLEWRAEFERSALRWFESARSGNRAFYEWNSRTPDYQREFYSGPRKWESQWFDALRKIKYGHIKRVEAPFVRIKEGDKWAF